MALLKIPNLPQVNSVKYTDLLIVETENGTANIFVNDVTEEWTFTLEDGSTVTKKVVLG